MGSTGHTGSVTVSRALTQDHTVRALARDPQKLYARCPVAQNAPNLTVVVGDVTDGRAVASLVEGADGVISCLGPTDPRTAGSVHSSAAKQIVALRSKFGGRYVALSGASFSVPTDKFNIRGKFYSWAGWLMTKIDKRLEPLLADKKREYEVLKDSELDWTIVRPPYIVPGEYLRDARVTPFKLGGSRVRIGELAQALLDLAGNTEHNKQAVFIHSVGAK